MVLLLVMLALKKYSNSWKSHLLFLNSFHLFQLSIFPPSFASPTPPSSLLLSFFFLLPTIHQLFPTYNTYFPFLTSLLMYILFFLSLFSPSLPVSSFPPFFFSSQFCLILLTSFPFYFISYLPVFLFPVLHRSFTFLLTKGLSPSFSFSLLPIALYFGPFTSILSFFASSLFSCPCPSSLLCLSSLLPYVSFLSSLPSYLLYLPAIVTFSLFLFLSDSSSFPPFLPPFSLPTFLDTK